MSLKATYYNSIKKKTMKRITFKKMQEIHPEFELQREGEHIKIKHKETGKKVWGQGDENAGYATPTPIKMSATEAATDTMPVLMPLSTVVAGPVSVCTAIFLTGLKWSDV